MKIIHLAHVIKKKLWLNVSNWKGIGSKMMKFGVALHAYMHECVEFYHFGFEFYGPWWNWKLFCTCIMVFNKLLSQSHEICKKMGFWIRWVTCTFVEVNFWFHHFGFEFWNSYVYLSLNHVNYFRNSWVWGLHCMFLKNKRKRWKILHE